MLRGQSVVHTQGSSAGGPGQAGDQVLVSRGGAGRVGAAVEVDDQAVLGRIRGRDPLAGNTAGVNLEDGYIRRGLELAKGLIQNCAGFVNVGRRFGPDGLH